MRLTPGRFAFLPVALLLCLPVAGGESPGLRLGLEVAYESSRTARESWRAELERRLRRELEEAACFREVVDAGETGDVLLDVRLREFLLEMDSGGEPRWDERTGNTLPGRSFFCRISLAYAIVPEKGGDPLHVDDLVVATREATTSNPLFDPESYALERAQRTVVRELRKKVCRRSRKIARALARDDR